MQAFFTREQALCLQNPAAYDKIGKEIQKGGRAGMKKMKAKLLAAVLAAAVFLGAVPLSAGAFSDVAQGAWYESAVTEMASQGYLFGFPDGRFRPGDTVSAGQFTSLVGRCSGEPEGTGQGSHWAAGWVQTALEKGWLDWDECPPTGELFDKPITRQLAVKLIMRALLPDARGDYTTESQKITDFAQLSGRYYETTFAAYAVGLVVGDPSGTFRPTGSLSRAEACVIIQKALKLVQGTVPPAPPAPDVPDGPVETIKGGASENGWLQVKGTQICNEKGQPVALHGMSTHGLQWYGQYAGKQAIQNTASFGANLFRVAMYTGENGYISQPGEIKKRAIAAIDAAIAQDMYVIIDWHILSDGNPMTYVRQAESFFSEVAERYKDTPNVLYEICNEPNGNVSWSRDVKPYAQRVVKAIRAHSEGLILVGSPTWSQDIHLAAQDPLEGGNLLYTLHFYAGTHGQELRTRIDEVLKKGLPIFVSEWGTSRADGSGGVFLRESAQWLGFLEERGISWANWSLCDKGETSAALKPGTPANRVWTVDDLSESGKFVFGRF